MIWAYVDKEQYESSSELLYVSRRGTVPLVEVPEAVEVVEVDAVDILNLGMISG